MYKSVKTFIWIIISILLVDESQHFLSDKMSGYLIKVILIALEINLIGILTISINSNQNDKEKK